MKALVLTYDKYRPLTEHMIASYNELWTDHPFQFIIPYQEERGPDSDRRRYVQSPSDIKSTVSTLLEGLPDEEWIYWCIDDKYPTWLDVNAAKQQFALLSDSAFSDELDGVMFCRCRNMLVGKALSGEQLRVPRGQDLLARSGYQQIWLHQFLRVKVLRYLFGQFPDEIKGAKIMDEYKRQVALPKTHHLYVTEKNNITFGESTTRGMLTKNCYRSLQRHQIDLPDMEVSEEEIVMGNFRGLPLHIRAKIGWRQLRAALKS